MKEGSRSDKKKYSKSHESKDHPVVRPKQIKFEPRKNPANLSLLLLED